MSVLLAVALAVVCGGVRGAIEVVDEFAAPRVHLRPTAMAGARGGGAALVRGEATAHFGAERTAVIYLVLARDGVARTLAARRRADAGMAVIGAVGGGDGALLVAIDNDREDDDDSAAGVQVARAAPAGAAGAELADLSAPRVRQVAAAGAARVGDLFVFGCLVCIASEPAPGGGGGDDERCGEQRWHLCTTDGETPVEVRVESTDAFSRTIVPDPDSPDKRVLLFGSGRESRPLVWDVSSSTSAPEEIELPPCADGSPCSGFSSDPGRFIGKVDSGVLVGFGSGVFVGSGSGFTLVRPYRAFDPSSTLLRFQTAADVVLFTAPVGSADRCVWRSDGTRRGTFPVTEAPFPAESNCAGAPLGAHCACSSQDECGDGLGCVQLGAHESDERLCLGERLLRVDRRAGERVFATVQSTGETLVMAEFSNDEFLVTIDAAGATFSESRRVSHGEQLIHIGELIWRTSHSGATHLTDAAYPTEIRFVWDSNEPSKQTFVELETGLLASRQGHLVLYEAENVGERIFEPKVVQSEQKFDAVEILQAGVCVPNLKHSYMYKKGEEVWIHRDDVVVSDGQSKSEIELMAFQGIFTQPLSFDGTVTSDIGRFNVHMSSADFSPRSLFMPQAFSSDGTSIEFFPEDVANAQRQVFDALGDTVFGVTDFDNSGQMGIEATFALDGVELTVSRGGMLTKNMMAVQLAYVAADAAVMIGKVGAQVRVLRLAISGATVELDEIELPPEFAGQPLIELNAVLSGGDVVIWSRQGTVPQFVLVPAAGGPAQSVKFDSRSIKRPLPIERGSPYLFVVGNKMPTGPRGRGESLLESLVLIDDAFVSVLPNGALSSRVETFGGRLYAGVNGADSSFFAGTIMTPGLYFLNPVAAVDPDAQPDDAYTLVSEHEHVREVLRCADALFFVASNNTELWQLRDATVERVRLSIAVGGLGCVGETTLLFHDVSGESGMRRVNRLVVGDGTYVETGVKPGETVAPPKQPTKVEPTNALDNVGGVGGSLNGDEPPSSSSSTVKPVLALVVGFLFVFGG